MPTSICTIGISYKENISMYGQEVSVYKPMYLARVIFPNHFRNEYDRVKQIIQESGEGQGDARIEILDKPSGKCGIVFNIDKELAKMIVDSSKLYYPIKY